MQKLHQTDPVKGTFEVNYLINVEIFMLKSFSEYFFYFLFFSAQRGSKAKPSVEPLCSQGKGWGFEGSGSYFSSGSRSVPTVSTCFPDLCSLNREVNVGCEEDSFPLNNRKKVSRWGYPRSVFVPESSNQGRDASRWTRQFMCTFTKKR